MSGERELHELQAELEVRLKQIKALREDNAAIRAAWGTNEAYLVRRIGHEDEPPHVEVTEIVGRFRKYDHCAIVVDRPDGVTGYLKLEDALPDEATTREHEGPRGRFRITVEFWPEVKE